MRVVHLINGLGHGGGERMLCDVVSGLRHEITFSVYCLSRLGPLEAELRRAGVSVYRLRRGVVLLPRAWRALRQDLARAEVVHSHFFYSDALASLLQAGRSRRRWLCTRHDTGYWMTPAHHLAQRVLYRRVERILCVSQAVRESLVARGIPPDKLWVVYPGVAAAEVTAKPTSDDPYILSVGRLERVKGHDVLLRAFSMLCASSQVPRVRLVIIGDGQERRTLEQQARRRGVAGRCVFVGSLPKEQISHWLAGAALFVLPSRSEALPLSLLEAMRAPVPCIATAVGGVPEIIVDGTSGCLVPPEAPDRLAQAMGEMLADPARAAAMAQEGVRTIRARFSRELFLGAMRELYGV